MQIVYSASKIDANPNTNIQIPQTLNDGILDLVEQIYPDMDLELLTKQIVQAFWPDGTSILDDERLAHETTWDEKDTYMITYGGTLVDGEHKPLDLLYDFLNRYLKDTITGVHILPYFPFTSDDGFAITDYCGVNSQLGAWEDIVRISDEFRLMSDLVINHCSSQSTYFNEYLQGHEPYDKFFFEASLEDDLSLVVRPRAHNLLREVETANGTKYVWCTFSHDQIDFDFSNPEVLFEFLRILRFHIEKGVRTLRLDAVAFLWKEIGTTSIHLPQTHCIVRLLRLLSDYNEQPLMLITETNVPNTENLSYFGNRNEAHAVYNFSLPPLLLHALHNGTSQYLHEWQLSMPPLQAGCTYFNFTASHDGIGMRPAEGYLADDQIDTMIETVKSFGGLVSLRQVSEGKTRPYEINTSLFDALKGTVNGEDEWNIERFLCSQIIAMGLQGIPGFYVHSLLATHNDYDGLEKAGHNRAINRHRWDYQKLRNYLDNGKNIHATVFNEMKRLINLRISQPAFHPNASQFSLELDDQLFGFSRQVGEDKQEILAIHNLSSEPHTVHVISLNMNNSFKWLDLISGEEIDPSHGEIMFSPYQCRWISNIG